MMAIIEPMRKLQVDRTGLNQLASKKLISDEYVAEFVASERVLNSEFEYCFREADSLESGWSKTIFEQAIKFWQIGIMKQMEASAGKS